MSRDYNDELATKSEQQYLEKVGIKAACLA